MKWLSILVLCVFVNFLSFQTFSRMLGWEVRTASVMAPEEEHPVHVFSMEEPAVRYVSGFFDMFFSDLSDRKDQTVYFVQPYTAPFPDLFSPPPEA